MPRDAWRGRGGWFWSREYEIYTDACMFSLCYAQHTRAFAPGVSTLNRVLELELFLSHI